MAGMDLSSLIKPAEAPTPVATVSDLVMVGAQSNIRDIIALSDKVPVIIEFHSTEAVSLGQKLETIVHSLAGKLLLVRVDGQKEPQLAAAFAIEQVPTVIALVKGQPVPLFQGDLIATEVEQYVKRLLEVSAQNGITGTISTNANPVSPVVEKAYEAIEAGDLAAARQVYIDALAENPRDTEFIAGLAQVNLMIRTSEFDLDDVLGNPAADIFQRADALAAVGHFEASFTLLLGAFAAAKDSAVKDRLLELFEVAGATDPAVIAARRALTSLLY